MELKASYLETILEKLLVEKSIRRKFDELRKEEKFSEK